MLNATLSAYPKPYSKACSTFRTVAGNSPATRASLGSVLLVHFLEHRAMLNSLVRELTAEGRPACIMNGLRHAGLGESFGTYVANSYVVELSDDASRELVVEVEARIAYSGVDVAGQATLLSSLRLRQLFLQAAEMPGVADLFATGERGEVFQSQIDTDTRRDFARGIVWHFDHDIQEPVAAPIARKVGTVLDLAFWERSGVEDSECVTSMPESVSMAIEGLALQWNPSERLLASITQVWALDLIPGSSVPATYSADCAGMQAEFLAAARSEIDEIKAGRPLPAPLERVPLPIIAVVEDEIYRPGLLVQ